jgi:fermentation-respiration switch protein FrsA (DUF1100 family)
MGARNPASDAPLMGLLKSLLIILLIGYVGLVALMYFAQRALMYFPDRTRTTPAAAGFPEAEEVVLDTADGERVIIWHVAAHGDRPVVLYFQGNGGALQHRVDRFRSLTADGQGLIALSYRGYGGSTGSPSETGILADAAAAYAFATSRYAADQIIVWGESLGTGVAIALTSERPVGRIILESPFSAAVDVAAAAYPFVPVRWLMKDQFRSDLRIAKVTAPILIMHGERDDVVPIAFGERLYNLAKSPKRFVRLAGGHSNLGGFGATEAVKTFLEEQFD